MKERLDRKNSDLKDRRLNFPISLTIKPPGFKTKGKEIDYCDLQGISSWNTPPRQKVPNLDQASLGLLEGPRSLILRRNLSELWLSGRTGEKMDGEH